jgi:hypothetical protein
MLYHLNLLELEKSQHFAEEAIHVAERRRGRDRALCGRWFAAQRI